MTGTVEVLLSTFKADNFLVSLLESVEAQDYPDVTLSVRDDGSGDAAVTFVRRSLSGRALAGLTEGEHVGAAQSFLSLIRVVGSTAGYAAFCDQDDVWLPGKLSAAVAALKEKAGPALYCSAVELVDRDLTKIKTHLRCVRGPSFANALVENIATGCTIVLNRPAIDLLAARMPEHCLMHDAWAYLVLSGCGEVVYDPTPWVLYRLHGSNAVGVGQTLWSEWFRRAQRQLVEGNERVLTRQAQELQDLYGPQLKPSAARILNEFLSSQGTIGRRLRYAFGGPAHRQRAIDDLVYRLLYIAHRV